MATQARSGSDPVSAATWTDQLAKLASAARAATDPAERAGLVAQMQRVTCWALRASVGEAHEHGVSWRHLASRLGVPLGTLHRQFQASGSLLVVRAGTESEAPPLLELPDPPTLPAAPLRAGGAAGAETAQLVGERPPVPLGGAPAAPPERDRGPAEPVGQEPPAPPDSLIGRRRELTDVSRLLGSCRLVTLTAPAGTGKTRLAMEVARRVQRSGALPVWLVELDPLGSSQVLTVGHTVAAALGVHERQDEDVLDTLAGVLGSRRALLVVDGCEHLVEDCAETLTRLLRRCPGMRVLVTSREPLRVPGEAVVPLEPLPGPSRRDPVDRAELPRWDAVRLLLDRARSAGAGVRVTTQTAEAVTGIHQVLNGSPLAIELVARRLPATPLAEAAHGLEACRRRVERSRPAGDIPTGLRAAIEWSHGLLSPTEQAVFRRQAVLAGTVDLAAATVCAGDGVEGAGVAEALGNLETCGLLSSVGAGGVRLAKPVRDFARARLRAAGEEKATYERLLTWLTDLVEPAVGNLDSSGEDARMPERYHTNLVHAVEWALSHDDWRQTSLAVGLAAHRRRGEEDRDRPLPHRVLAFSNPPLAQRALTLDQASLLAHFRGDYEEARALGEQAVEIGSSLGPQWLARFLHVSGRSRTRLGDLAGAVACFQERLELVRPLNRPVDTAVCEAQVAWTAVQAGELELAQSTVEEALDVLTALGEPEKQLSVLHTRGALALARGQLDQAESQFLECLTLSGIDWRWGGPGWPWVDFGIVYNVEGMAIVAGRRGQAQRVLRLASAASRIRSRLHEQAEPWWQEQLDAATAMAYQQLPAERANAALEAGTGMRLDLLIGYAREVNATGRNGDRPPLTALERQVAALVSQGLTDSQIGRRMGMAERTVVSHLERIRTKLGLPSRIEVALWAAAQADAA
jgi:predicted ATPase/DNA-binding CsgD family transcriptional regulator